MVEEGLQVQEVPGPSVHEIDGVRYRNAHTLRDLVNKFGGYTGEMIDPVSGQRVAVSLERWRGRDFDATYLTISSAVKRPPRRESAIE